MSAVFLLALALSVSASQAPAGERNVSPDSNAPAALHGRIVDERGRGVPGAVIMLHGGPAPGVFTTMTDTNGAFRFDDVAADSYTLRAMKRGYPPIEYGQAQPLGPGMLLVLRPGESATISARMPRGAVITGIARDEHGKPLEGQVVLVNRTDGRKLPRSPMESPVTTDAAGGFRIFGLPAGSYIVKARRTAGSYREDAPSSNDVTVSLSEGEERGGIVLRLPPLTADGRPDR